MACHLPNTNLHLGDWSPTPLTRVALDTDGPCIWSKLEFMNPGGSTKDRIANHILTKAVRSGAIKPGGAVVEASSGSTSIAMAMVCAQLGLNFTAVMPAGVSNERSLIIKAYGGKVHHAGIGATMLDCIAEAKRLAKENGAFFPAQFENPDNAEAHRFGTAREIIKQLPTQHVDAFVAGVGTGGTLVGLYQGLRDHGCHATPVLAKPIASSGGSLAPGCFDHAECCSTYSKRIPGVVDNMSCLFQPAELGGLQTIEVSDSHAIETARKLIRLGFPVGPSSGLNFAAAERVYDQLKSDGISLPTVVTVFCDRMERYFSTELFSQAQSAVPEACHGSH
jgi:cysteine synthase A